MELVEAKFIENIMCDKVKTEEVESILKNTIPEIIMLIARIEKKHKIKCFGLAAPQVGIFKKFFIKRSPKGYDVYFNSWYIKNNSSRMTNKEGCFSYGLGKKPNNVKRWKSIYLFTDEWDKENKTFKRKQKKRVTGIDAIVFQHEIDHHGNGENGLSKTIFT